MNFNSTVVRLKERNRILTISKFLKFQFNCCAIKGEKPVGWQINDADFNSTVVRLKEMSATLSKITRSYFNSTVVRLKAVNGPLYSPPSTPFQFNCCAIKGKLLSQCPRSSAYFNSTVVRLKAACTR